MPELVLPAAAPRPARSARITAPLADRLRHVQGALMALPAMVLLLAFVLVPLGAVIAIAFTDYQMGSSRIGFVGLRNIFDLLGDRAFLAAVGNTMIYVAVVVPLTIGLGLVVALLVHGLGRGRSFYRTVYFLPSIVALAASSVAWQMILHPTNGLLNQVLALVGIAGPNWLKDPDFALPALALIGIWERLGFTAVFYLAALGDLPPQLSEAARIDGAAGPWDRFWLVVWPHLRPMTLFLTVTAGIHAFQAFETVAILTQGGPQRSTQVLLFTIYQEAFVFFRTSYAATATLALLVILVAFSALQFKSLRQRRSAA